MFKRQYKLIHQSSMSTVETADEISEISQVLGKAKNGAINRDNKKHCGTQ
jgi:hypothetical protein